MLAVSETAVSVILAASIPAALTLVYQWLVHRDNRRDHAATLAKLTTKLDDVDVQVREGNADVRELKAHARSIDERLRRGNDRFDAIETRLDHLTPTIEGEPHA